MFDQSSAQSFRRGQRSVAGVAVSIAVHIGVGLGVVWIIQNAPVAAPRVMKSALTFMAVSPLPAVPYEPEPQPLVLPKLEVETTPEAMAEMVTIPAPAVVESKRPDVQPLLPDPPAPKEQIVAKIEMPKPAPQVTVGAFAEGPAPTRTLNASRQVDAAGFDAPAAQTAERKIKDTAAVGAFESAPAASPRAGTDRPVGTLVADAGFGRTAVATARPAPTREVSDVGFGGLGGQRPPNVAAQAKEVKDSGFAAQPAAPASTPKGEPRPERVEIPVEVISKPNPTYTAEARDLRLEGEVSLEVEFCASGSVRVLRVIRGLGHGLDEAAIQAAERIRFKPAQSHGQAVDFKTTVHITFKLT